MKMLLKSIKSLVEACIVFLLLAAMLSSCGVIDDGRMAATKDIRVAEEGTKQELLKTKQAALSAKKTGKKANNPTLKTTTYDQAGKVVAVTEMDLQPMIAELGLNKEDTATYGVELTSTKLPPGQMAENITAASGFVAEVGGAPATIIYTTGKGIGAALKETGGGTKITGDEINIDGSFTRNDNTAIGEGNAITSGFSLDRSHKTEFMSSAAE